MRKNRATAIKNAMQAHLITTPHPRPAASPRAVFIRPTPSLRLTTHCLMLNSSLAKKGPEPALLLHRLDHLARFVELLDEAVHFVDGAARAARDALAPARGEQLRIVALLLRHRLDDRLRVLH